VNNIAHKIPSLNEVTKGNATYHPDMPVWFSTMGSKVWSFIDPTSPLYAGEAASSINWFDLIHGCGALNNRSNSKRNTYTYCLTEEIVADLKIAAIIHGHFPKLLKHSRRTKTQIDPKTVKGRIEELAKFFSLTLTHLSKTEQLKVIHLSDIPFRTIRNCVPKYSGRSSHLKRSLKLISDPIVQKNLSAPLQWNLIDITSKSLKWNPVVDLGGIPVLTDPQFLFLISTCRRMIGQFKNTIEMELHDTDAGEETRDNIKSKYPNFQGALNQYYTYKLNRDSSASKNFKKKFGYKMSAVTDFIIEAHNSAIIVILLLTGMRESETMFLMRDCLDKINGYYFLKSKVVKQRPSDTPVSEGWLAIELTLDAYEILQLFCKKTGGTHLFSSPNPVYRQRKKTGYSLGTMNIKFNRWITKIDTDKLFKDHSFSVHQCRETLVYQLARHGVGLPFISMQLKHFNNRFSRMPNDVTAGYGEYRKQLLEGVQKRKAEARESALLEVYGEDSHFAGGGAESHKARIDTFFAGMGLFGEDREKYIKKMARQGVKLMPTSIGSCTKNFHTIKQGEDLPPCYGDYGCDPDCSSHVISNSCGQALRMRRKHALKQANQEVILEYKNLWLGLAEKFDNHITCLTKK